MSGHRFRRQVPLGCYVADFVCYAARLVIEIDGGQHMDQAARDLERDRWFESQHFKVLRFWNNQVLRETDAVMEVIVRALAVPPAHPSPEREEVELARGVGRNFATRPFPQKRTSEDGIGADPQHTHCTVPPPLAGGGEGEG